MKFQEALDNNPAPEKVGDARIRLDPPVLLGEARRPKAWGVLLLAQTSGAATAVSSIFWLLFGSARASIFWPSFLIFISAVCVAVASYFETRGSRRRFILNFSTYTLRLDFSTPLRGMPRSITLPFEDVSNIETVDQDDGLHALVVEFRQDGKRYREVLAANIPSTQSSARARLEKMLRHALGLS